MAPKFFSRGVLRNSQTRQVRLKRHIFMAHAKPNGATEENRNLFVPDETSNLGTPAPTRDDACNSQLHDNAMPHNAREDEIQFNATAAVEFARHCGGLKTTVRTGWLRRSVPYPESVADHSWRVAALCLLLDQGCSVRSSSSEEVGGAAVNISKCMELAIIHDLAESIVGDIAPSDNVPKDEKRMAEERAMQEIAAALGRASGASTDGGGMEGRLLAAFEEYERRESVEAIAVKDLDLLDMIVQADEYERANPGIDLDEFFSGTPTSMFRNEIVRKVALEIHRQRDERMRKECVATDSKKGSYCLGTTEEKSADCTNPEQPGNMTYRDMESSLSEHDTAFVTKFATSSRSLTVQDIESIVRALRASERQSRT